MRQLSDTVDDLATLAALAGRPDSLPNVLDLALQSLDQLIPYDLAAVLQLTDGVLRVRAARGALVNERVRQHSIRLEDFPTIQQALRDRQPVALTDDHHSSNEGDPYDGILDLPHGHSCMVVPLFVGEQTFGALTFDRQVCVTYDDQVVRLAAVYGQIVALAILLAEQSERLSRHNQGLRARQKLVDEASGVTEAGRRLERSRSPVMQQLVARARLVADTDTAVLITGETGVGKEVLAQAIHGWSRRAEGPFLALNCAAIPENLVESELFGHVKGAFTGASRARDGRFQLASGGTLLLDEVGDLPLAAQGKLLRVLQEGTLQPVGSDRTVRVDVRVIAATHVDLAQAVRAGRFREDLYYRLAVFPLQVPALRDRSEDIVLIARDVLELLSRRTGRGGWELSEDAAQMLSSRPWPGNVRELVNALERATILSRSGRISAGCFDLPSLAAEPSAPVSPSGFKTLKAVEAEHIRRVLASTDGKLFGEGGAAEILGLKPTTLQSRMKKLGIDRSNFT